VHILVEFDLLVLVLALHLLPENLERDDTHFE
jgi:hypothetical protein